MDRVIRAALRAAGGIAALAAILGFGAGAFAAAPEPWQMGMQQHVSPVGLQINSFHNLLLWIITVIALFVLALLIVTMVRFHAARNPTPSRTTHNTLLEIAWTAVPVLILVVIAVPSLRLLYFMDRAEKPDMTIKVTGKQWMWAYEYPDHGGFQFDSNMVPTEDLKPGQKRLLEVDNRVVVPVGATIRILLAGNDVMHSWFVPALGVQTYTVPGRINESWIRVDKPGVYYGQCNQICGVNHAYMPIAVEAVSKADFDKWVEQAKKEFAGPAVAPATALASAR